ncbi:hypothetical protein [Photorhabdus laumondii]|uniref:hypothetical protein n=1 Tax=Photorhabdus laumondii TaxID=2218628 RepID=UPI0033151BC1
MKKKRLRKFQKELETLGLIEKDPDVVGYVLFNTHNRRFVILDEYALGSVAYADNIEDAYLATSRFAALMDIDSLPEPDKFDIAVIPVIDNPLFGLIPKKTD